MMNTHSKIVTAIRGGDSATAVLEADRLLAVQPADAELLGLKGLALAVGGQMDEAAHCVRMAARLATTPAQRLKHLGNLARLLERLNRHDELAQMAASDLPRPGQLADAELDAGALENLCAPLLAAEQFTFLASYLAPILDRPATSWPLEELWLKAAAGAGHFDSILARTAAPTYRWRQQPQALALACIAAARLNRRTEGKALYSRYLDTSPAYAAPRTGSQIMSIVVIAQSPLLAALSLPPAQQHFSGNFPTQLAQLRPDRYRFFSVFEGSRPQSAKSLMDGMEPAVTLNNCVNGEDLKRGELANVERHEQALGLPVINAASGAAHSTRVETADLLRGIPNLVVPNVMRFRLDAALVPSLRVAIRDAFSFPVILRTVGEQEARNVHLVHNDEELGHALGQLIARAEKDFYAIEYVGVHHENGYSRRLRAAYVEDEPTLMRSDYDAQWIVKGRKNQRIQDLYRREPALFEKANALVARPEQMGDAALAALREIGRRMPLDVFGIDFDVDRDGRVVFFEANASMNLLSNAPTGFEYPADGQSSFLDRLDAYLLKRAGITYQ